MALAVGVGYSSEDNAHQAGQLAAQAALTELIDRGGKEPHAALVFSSVAFDQTEMLRGIRAVAPQALIVGCSTAGEITNEGPLPRSSVTVMFLHSDTMRFYGGIGEDIKTSAHAAGAALARSVLDQLPAGERLTSFIMLPDVLVGNGSETVAGALSVLGENFPVVGGAAGDDFQFKQTFQYFGDKAYSGAVAGLGLSGAVKFGIGVRHGWAPIGLPMKVTKSEGSVLHEVDGKPAISVYENYFGDYADELREDTLAKLAITYPLGIRDPDSDEYLIRDPLSVNEKGSITCAAAVPEGSEIRLMIGSKREAIEMAKIAASQALSQLDGAPARAIIVFNCIARRKLFGEDAGDEIRAIQEVLGHAVPLIGFYTYGEQAPLGGETRNIERCNTTFHNETIVLYVLGE